MTDTRIAGLKAGHQMITPTCRANRTVDGAFDEAAARLRESYRRYAASEASNNTTWHLVLVREDPE